MEKVIFVVDRKDLDYQTMKEYDRFAKGAANSNSIYYKHVVLVLDECHRSQFGKMHRNITQKFKMYNIFGYTGTPIFAINASASGGPFLKTTVQAFGCAVHGDDLPVCSSNKNHQSALHTYTIVEAIHDTNVLPFRIDFHKMIKIKNGVKDVQVSAIDTERALVSSDRIKAITSYILEHFDQNTYRNESGSNYTHRAISNVEKLAGAKSKVTELKETKRVNGFNSILCVSSALTIDGKRVAPVQLYYDEFKRQLAETKRDLKVATIFRFNQNEDEPLDGEDFDTESLDASSREFLDRAIADYNAMFGTTYDSSSDKFQNYYKDLSLRVKNREVDLLIVVNMFLTGFDATTRNTLWVDKNLKMHGLIQAFSRTNRILNSVKKFGNIVCFRDLEKETEEAVSIFGDKEAGGIVILRTFGEYMDGFENKKGEYEPGYVELINQLEQEFPLNKDIIGEEKEKELTAIITEENLKDKEARKFVNNAFRDGAILKTS